MNLDHYYLDCDLDEEINQTINCIKTFDNNCLIFKDEYNDPINEHMLKKLHFAEQVIFGEEYNQPIDYLPDNIKIIIFKNKFNSRVKRWPAKLKYLMFGNDYNQVSNNLPESLEELYFGNNFDKPLLSLPPNLRLLEIGEKYSFNLESLPDSLEYIKISSIFTQIKYLPKKLTTLEMIRDSPFVDHIKNSFSDLQLVDDNITY